MKIFSSVYLLIALLPLSGFFSPQAAAKTSGNDKIVAVVNGDPIYEKELNSIISRRSSQDPSFKVTPETLREQLDLMIDKRLMIQEAMKRKLAEEDQFVFSIKNYWEQTLIKRLTEKMFKDLEGTSRVDEKEIEDYYSKLSVQVLFGLIRTGDAESANALIEKSHQGQSLSWEETVGPITFDQLSSDVLEKAFDLPLAQPTVFSDEGVYYVVSVVSRESTSAPALEKIREQIKNKILSRLQKQALTQWLEAIKEKSKIQIYV